MNKNDFIRYIRQPADIRNINNSEITYLINKFPYFQSAHLVYAAYLSSKDDILFHDQLKLTAAHVNDRSVLYWLIYNQGEVSTTEPITHNEKTAVSPDTTTITPVDPYKEEAVTEAKIEFQEIIPAENTPETAKQEPEETETIPAVEIKTIEETIATPTDVETADEIKPETAVPAADNVIQEAPEKQTFTSHHQPETFLLNIISKRVISDQATEEKSALKPSLQKPVPVVPEKVRDLIDKFIKEEPRISKPRRDFFNPSNMAENSNIDKEDIVSETLAKIYISQNLFPKALKIYQKLYLLIPEKSAYFAAQIQDLENKINN
ncbi:MAG TPA: hypothetical protein PKI01_01690 [Bacteroidales bacterium]|nr:hypothetical protein [Bacteroidales bacterium]